MSQVPRIGQFVDYTLTAIDVARIDELRGMRHVVGNQPQAGQVCPMLIVRAWGDTPASSVNGQVFLDGDDTLWVTSRSAGDGAGHFTWPVPA